MRALLLLALASNLGCAAIVGSFEIEGKDAATTDATSDAFAGDTHVDSSTVDASAADSPTVDSSTVDTQVADTAVTDTAPIGPISCKALFDANDKQDGPRLLRLPSGNVNTFCDMRNGGWTLVAMRKSTSPGTAWINESGVTLSKDVRDIHKDEDRVLDVDWRELGFTDVIYDLGAGQSTMGPPPEGSRLLFANLDATQQGLARAALGKKHMPTERIDCVYDSVTYMRCLPPPPPPGDPGAALGWVYAPKGTICSWASEATDAGASLGAAHCGTGVVGKGRIWVK